MTECLAKEHHNILFLRANNSIHSLLSSYLERNNYDVTIASEVNLSLSGENDLVLINISPPENPGIEMINTIRSRFSKKILPIIVLSATDDPDTIARFFYFGVNDLLSTTMTPREIIVRVDAQLKLKRTMGRDTPSGFESFIKALQTLDFKLPEVHDFLYEIKCSSLSITPRQKEIIRLVIRGRQDKEIAAELNIATRTVNNHLENIYSKCGVHSRMELASILFLDHP